MTSAEARELIEESLLFIVPDADLAGLEPDADFREALELDSLDFVVLVERLSGRSGVRIEEEDYDQLRTMQRAVDFLAARADGSTSA